ncbi:MAG: family 16 glycosylhydrolase [Janthinobacterium lividum]
MPDGVSTTRITFDEEFNDLSLSSGSGTRWLTQFPYWGNDAYSLWGNHELEFYSNPSIGVNPFSLQNGALVITASPGSNILNQPYNSGTINTFNSFAQTYGYFEARMQLPSGQGLWPAFWMLPASNTYSSELDIAELIGNRPDVLNSTVHGVYNGVWQMHAQGAVIPDSSQGFHNYGVDWEPATTTFYFDDKAVLSVATPDSMNQPMYMLLNLAVGGDWPGSPDSSTRFPADMKIDWVHAYATANTRDVSGSAALSPSAASPVVAAPGPTYLGSGPDTIHVGLSEDAFRGDAQAIITIDGQTIGGTQTITASHAAGQSQDFAIAGSWGASAHTVGIRFINDAYDPATAGDRNLYVDRVSLNGQASTPGSVAMLSNGQATLAIPGAAGKSLVLHVNESAYQGDAQFTVAVDGKQQGGILTATASSAAGAWQDIDLGSSFTPGVHDIAVTFLNDLYNAGGDRNLFIGGAAYGGVQLSGATASLYSAGTTHLALNLPG